jgi:hypothetical protein
MAVTYPANSPVSQDELKDALRYSAVGSVDTLARLAIRVVGIMQEITECEIVSTLEEDTYYAEFHDLAVPQGFVYVRHRPIRSVRVLKTGLPGSLFTFDAADYIFDADKGMVMLKRGAVNPGAWRPPGFIDFPEDYFVRGLGVKTGAGFNPGVGSVYLEYQGGYASADTVPGSLKGAFIDIASRIYRTEENKSQGKAQEVAAGLSIATKFNQDYMSNEVREVLRRNSYLGKTARMTLTKVDQNGVEVVP